MRFSIDSFISVIVYSAGVLEAAHFVPATWRYCQSFNHDDGCSANWPRIARCPKLQLSGYIDFMATHGICKITNGWVHEDSVWVQYDDGERLEIPASQYREENYQPPIDALPECSGQHEPRGPKGEKRRD